MQGSVAVQHVAAAGDPVLQGDITGSLFLGAKEDINILNAFPTGVNLFNPARNNTNFQAGFGGVVLSLGVPAQGAGNSGRSNNVPVS